MDITAFDWTSFVDPAVGCEPPIVLSDEYSVDQPNSQPLAYVCVDFTDAPTELKDNIQQHDAYAHEFVRDTSSSISIRSERTLGPSISLSTDLGRHGTIAVSNTFNFEHRLNGQLWDVLLTSQDHVFFACHQGQLLSLSNNHFNGLLPVAPGKAVEVPDDAKVINIILHAIYTSSPKQYGPSLKELSAAMEAMAVYGLEPTGFLHPSSPLYDIFISHALCAPLESYALSAAIRAESLAVAISPFLLTADLTCLTDALADRMGARYLKRLFFLHLGRVAALKRILLPPPEPHPPTAECNFDMQRAVSRAWILAAAYLSWDPKPSLTNAAIQSALEPLARNLSCAQCKELHARRLRNVVVQWSLVKRTI